MYVCYKNLKNKQKGKRVVSCHQTFKKPRAGRWLEVLTKGQVEVFIKACYQGPGRRALQGPCEGLTEGQVAGFFPRAK
jgi:hypothetical protein